MDQNVKLIHETAVRWSTTVANADIAALGELMTDDIVVIHGNGRMLEGKEAVTADLVRGLADVRIEQSVSSEETVVTGEWAFDRASVQTIITCGQAMNRNDGTLGRSLYCTETFGTVASGTSHRRGPATDHRVTDWQKARDLKSGRDNRTKMHERATR